MTNDRRNAAQRDASHCARARTRARAHGTPRIAMRSPALRRVTMAVEMSIALPPRKGRTKQQVVGLILEAEAARKAT